MNAERLYLICKEIQEELNGSNLVRHFQVVIQSLKEVVKKPDPNHQNNLSGNLKQLYETLSSSKSDSYSPLWKQTLDEIGGTDLLGNNLETKIRNILERNQITPAAALQELEPIFKSVQKFLAAIDSTTNGLENLNIGSEKLKPGECELGVFIPRKAVQYRLNDFSKELQDLNFIYSNFSEVISDERDNFEIKAISSTDMTVYLAVPPPLAACVAHATEKIIAMYKALLEIGKLKSELKKQGIKEEAMQGITDHANSEMKKGIDKLTNEIIEEYYGGKEKSRKNELKNSVKISLNKIANRIDKGFNFEVRLKPLKEANEKTKETNEANDQNRQFKKHFERIFNAAETLKFIK